MIFKEYQIAALKTAIYPKDSAVAYCTLGLVGEIAELIDERLSVVALREDYMKEMGDVLWYIATLAHETGVDLRDDQTNIIIHLADRENVGVSILAYASAAAGQIANKAKKTIRDGKPLDKEFVARQLAIVLEVMACEAKLHNFTVGEAMAKNIAKLADRAERGVIKGSGDNR